ncbi:leucyl aminopeptidase [Streptomyces sp. SID8361]|nr:leucyl aminopeptidase [Streptomyces sp. SID8361]
MPRVSLGAVAPDHASVGSLVLGVDTSNNVTKVVHQQGNVPSRGIGKLNGLLSSLVHDWGDRAITFPAPDGFPTELVTLVHLGDPVFDSSVVRLRRAAGVAARSAKTATHVVFALPVLNEQEAAAVTEGAILGGYAFAGLHGSSHPQPATPQIHVMVPAGITPATPAIGYAVESARSVIEARNLVNLPPNELHPESFAEFARVTADAIDHVEVQIWDEEALASEGFGGLIGVGQGSVHGPRLVRIRYTPDDAAKHIALVGKGITFDSGGLNIKPAHLDYMNFDMSGAAAVLATVVAAARMKLQVEVTGWLALAENLPSGTAQRPSDVITMRNGMTIEVRDTDYEGRLVLADAITAACGESPDVVVDIATLTGAQEIALGLRMSGVMSNSEELLTRLARVATDLDEPHWPMPLPSYLKVGLKSRVADMANKGYRYAGMLTAGLFLEHFISEAPKVPQWAHFDICGPAINRELDYGFTPLGGTGAGVRTMIALAADLANGSRL